MDQVGVQKRTPFVVGLTAFYTAIGLLISALLLWTLAEHPPSSDAVEDPDWANAWTGAFLGDSFALAMCFCGVICMTEPGLSAGVWSVLQLVLGPLISCVYMVHCFRWYGGFRIRSNRIIYQRPLGLSGPNLRATMAFFYVLVALAFTVRVGWNQVQFPLLPLKMEDLDWSTEWLVTSMLTFYAMAFCFLAFVWSSQEIIASLLWCGAILVIGAPVCCAYVVFRLLEYDTVALCLYNDGRTPHATPQPAAKAVGTEVVADVSSKNSSRTPSKQSSAGAQEPKSKISPSPRSASKDFANTQSSKSQTPSNKDFGKTQSARSQTPPSKEGNNEARITSRVLIHSRRPDDILQMQEDEKEEEEIMHAI